MSTPTSTDPDRMDHLLASATLCHDTPLLGWTLDDNTPVLWDDPRPLALLGYNVGASERMDGLLQFLAAQAHSLDPGRVEMFDLRYLSTREPELWPHLSRAGLKVHTLANDPGRVVGALAALAGSVAYHHRAGTTMPRRWLCVDHWGSDAYLTYLLTRRGLHGYASAARESWRIIATHGPAAGVRLLLNGSGWSTPLAEHLGMALYGAYTGEESGCEFALNSPVTGKRVAVFPPASPHTLEKIARPAHHQESDR